MSLVVEITLLGRIEPVVGDTNGESSDSIGSSQVELLGIF